MNCTVLGVAGSGLVSGSATGSTLFLVELQASTVTATSGTSSNTREESIVGTAGDRRLTLIPGGVCKIIENNTFTLYSNVMSISNESVNQDCNYSSTVEYLIHPLSRQQG